jgi:methylated-DNA-[protein]-cysteine S-methyltransferase
MTTTILPSPLGDLLLLANETKLTGLYFAGEKHAPDIRAFPRRDDHPILKQAFAELSEYFNGARTSFCVPLAFSGTPFQVMVWQQIAQIPLGRTISYSEVARRAGAPASVRAVGTATGRNPISIIVPCHRVVGKSGGLQGFAGGLDRKQRLLDLERVA